MATPRFFFFLHQRRVASIGSIVYWGIEICRMLPASYGNRALLKSGVFEWRTVFKKPGSVVMNVILRSVRVTFAAVVKQYILTLWPWSWTFTV